MTPAPRTHRRGRRPAATIPAQRRRHLLALALRTVAQWPSAVVCRLMDLSRRGLQIWMKRARTYPEAQTRERLIQSSGMKSVMQAMSPAA